ncbi:sigma-70 family RNA polymerase sigma factor [Nocardioides sp. cx-173]|uniref:sigma-70 family RNA polymerase sigma factor n=1 Tax=Nocardioides sp. cx-173 TaxID=2898796 RepID=UPI003FA55927
MDDFDEFVQARIQALHAFAASLTGDHHEAWDLVQDALMRLAVAWDRVDCARNPDAYARTILVRLNLNRLRRLGRETRAYVRFKTDDSTRQPQTAEPPDPQTWLAAALHALPARQRTAVALVHVWEFTLSEAAEFMGCSPNTAKTHVARGMKTLRAVTSERKDDVD